MTGAALRSDAAPQRRQRALAGRDPFFTRMLWLAAALFTGCGYALLDFGINGGDDRLTEALLWAIVGLLSVIASNTGSSHRFLFSCAFWVTVDFLFYIVLKALAVFDEAPARPMQMALLSSLVFLLGYVAGQLLWPTQRLLHVTPSPKLPGSRGLYIWLVTSFFAFKALNILLLMAVGGGETALELAQTTQNAGASYLFKIPTLATASYFLVLLLAYKHRLYRRTATTLTLIVILEAVVGAARFTLVSTALIHLLLCHLYVRRVRMLYLVLLGPLLIFIVAFFGLVRDIQVGSLNVYSETLITLVEDRELIFKVFMGRMDMLPQMADGFELARLGRLKFEGGMSYVYAFLHAVPRNIWPDKPPLTAAYVTELVKPYAFADGVNVYSSAMLEAYMNLRWAGVFLIGTALAGLSRLYEQALLRGSLRAQALALMAFTFPMQLVNEGIHSNILGSLLYVAAIFGLWLLASRAVMGAAVAKRLARP
ncbi:O-antigen polymerase [Aquincola sp. J276]|uniref:O-antigen polymerase n=1 Tax=Aquincola sp. J276 TaxID=2898432 RepID=UPI002151B7B4|nr:O-antigen polymerase [Aquincola sp. J276]MCR5866964.1 oligosaccharide repeat unit polymerase [Aquincola sp. J276]